MKRVLSFLLLLTMLVGMLPLALFVSAETAATGLVTDGLEAYYDGTNNSNGSHDKTSATWKDVSGNGRDITVPIDSTNYWTDEALHFSSLSNDRRQINFSSDLAEIVSGTAYTIELTMGEFSPEGVQYPTLLHGYPESGSESLVLFIASTTDNGTYTGDGSLSYKNGGNVRPITTNAIDTVKNSTVTITFECTETTKVCKMYVDGVEVSSKEITSVISVSTLFLGCNENRRNWTGDVRGIRFYSKALTATEVAQNAAADKAKFIPKGYSAELTTEGLYAHYDAVNNAGNGTHDATATVWKNLTAETELDFSVVPVGSASTISWIDNALHVNKLANQAFPSKILDLVNSDTFTLEMTIGEYTPNGGYWSSLFRSANGTFNLQTYNNPNKPESKGTIEVHGSDVNGLYAGIHEISGTTITITFEKGGSFSIYVDGVKLTSKKVTANIGATDALYLGGLGYEHYWEGDIHSIRFYNKVLTAQEIAANVEYDDAMYRSDIVMSGLFAYYDGANNSNGSQNTLTTVWKDLSGNGIDFTIPATNSTNYWTNNALHVDSRLYTLPDHMANLISGNEYTVEISIGKFVPNGEDTIPSIFYSKYPSSDSTEFSIFYDRREQNGGDTLSVKASSTSHLNITDGLEQIKRSTIAITFKYDPDNAANTIMVLYVDGVEVGSDTSLALSEITELYLCSGSTNRKWSGDVHSIRFYDRALTASEVLKNAEYDAHKYTIGSQVSQMILPDKIESNVFTAPSVIARVDAVSTLTSATTKPTTAIFTANNDGKTAAGTAYETSTLCAGMKVIPAFEVETETALRAVIENLEEEGAVDYFIISKNAELLDLAHTLSTWPRTVLNVTEENYKKADGTYDLLEIRGIANAAETHIVILPEALCNRYNMDYLQSRYISCWATAENTEYGVHNAILSGGYGVVTDQANVTTVENILVNDFELDTMTRQIYIAGHRGSPWKYPENTIESVRQGLAEGADTIEFDLDLTKDGVVVLMHDATIDKTLTGTGSTQLYTLDELRAMDMLIKDSALAKLHGKEVGDIIEGYQIATFEEVLIEFKKTGSDKVMMIEMERGGRTLVDKVVQLLKKYQLEDKANVISFNGAQIDTDYLHEIYPEISIVWLPKDVDNSTYVAKEETIAAELKSWVDSLNHHNTLGPADGLITPEHIRQLNAHGILATPWTYYENGARFKLHFLAGPNYMITDNAYGISNTVKYLFTGDGLETTEINLAPGQTLNDVFKAKTYKGDVTAGGNIVVVSGDTVVSANGNSLTALSHGTAYVYAAFQTVLFPEWGIRQNIHVTSGLIKVNVHTYDNANDADCNDPGCTETKDRVIEALVPTHVRLGLSDEIVMSFRVPADRLTGLISPVLNVTIDGKAYALDEYTVDADGAYIFTTGRISPTLADKQITYVLSATNGTETVYGPECVTSIEAYCTKTLASDADAKLKTLIADMLNYAAAAQKNDDATREGFVNVSNLVYSGFETKAENVTNITLAANGYAHTNNTGNPADNKITAATVSLKNGIRLKITDVTGLKLVVKDANGNVIETIETFTEDGGYYYADFYKSSAAQFRKLYTFVLVDEDGNDVETMSNYSFEYYAYSIVNSDEYTDDLQALVKAMIAYGDSAYNYVSAE